MRWTSLLLVLFAFGCASTSTPTIAGRLETTPRHDEWVEVRQGDRVVHSYVVYPEASGKSPAIVVIHENRGLTDWVRSVADRLAENGYIAIAPDLLSGAGPNGGRTKDFATEDAARTAIGALPRAQYLADLKAVVDYARHIPAANGKVSVGGFCWGGSRTWDVAAQERDLAAAYVFYGTGPQTAEGVATITAPVYGFYGGNDERVNATIPKSEELMRAAGKTYEPVIYDGAVHAYMRMGEAADATEANRVARERSWARWIEKLRAHR